MSRQAKDIIVRLKALNGFWETCGSDRARGVLPESVVLSANPWGSDQATFALRRDPKALWPDIGPFTPVKIEVGGALVWSGRVKETPSKDGTDRVMSVTCEGWQYHLDDDVYERVYIHNKLGDWKDARSIIGSQLTRFTTIGKVQTDRAITIGWAKGDVITTNNVVGVTLDLGAAYARRVIVNWERTGGQTDTFLVCSGHNTPDVFGTADGFFSTPALNGEAASGAYIGDSTAPVRYVTIYIVYTGAGGTFAADVLERITSVQVYGDTSYHSAGLKAPTVITDALSKSTMLLSADRSQLDPSSTVAFNIPSLAPGEPRTPREMWDAVNAYHNYLSKIDVDVRPVFGPKPARPKYTVGSWSPMELEDASANSGLDVYNRALGTGQDVSGNQIRVSRLSSNIGATTVIDRRGFQRTKVLQIRSTLPADGVAAAQICDVWLSGHTTTPFKGTAKLTGDQAVRNRTEGTNVPLERLLLNTGELMHFSDRVNPDTGGWGRDGRLTQVQWVAASNEATVTLDNSRADFETMLERLAVVTGSG